MSYAEAHSAAAAALAAGDAGDALELLRPEIEYPAAPRSDEEWTSALQLLARIYAGLDRPQLEQAARAAAGDARQPVALHRLGAALISAQQPALATTMLTRALSLVPRDERVLAELAAALELQGRFDESKRQLAAANPRGFLPRYLLAFATLMTGDIAEARNLANTLTPASDEERFMHNRLVEIFARIDAIAEVTPLDASDRRGWHFALTGGFLLQLAPPPSAQPGVYDRLEDSNELCREGLRRLAAVAEVLRIKIPRVLVFQNPESRRLGLAAAEVFGVAAIDVHLPESPGLFVAYDLGSIVPEVLNALRHRVKGLCVFSHAAEWTRERKVVSDFTTVHYDTIVTPWQRHLIYPTPPDVQLGIPTPPDELLAQKIAAAKPATGGHDDLPQLLALAKAGKKVASAVRADGLRERQWARARG